jgi:hypothetical protein
MSEDGRQSWELKSASAVVPGSMRSRSWSVVACMRDVCLLLCVQEPLMAFASSAVAAMEAHREDADVLHDGLWLLVNLSEAEGNKV